jgi:plastocyanin
VADVIGSARPSEFRKPPVPTQRWIVAAVTALCLAIASASSASAQELHEIHLIAEPAQESYRFEPSSTKAKPGDLLQFRVMSGAPHSVVFERAGLSESVHQAWNAALTRRAGDLSGPLLGRNGMTYRVIVPAVPAGTYRFFCLTHRAYDERGEVVVR